MTYATSNTRLLSYLVAIQIGVIIPLIQKRVVILLEEGGVVQVETSLQLCVIWVEPIKWKISF